MIPLKTFTVDNEPMARKALREELEQIPGVLVGGEAERWSRKIIGKTGDEYILLNPSEVFAFKAEGEVVWIITSNKKYQATHTLAQLQVRFQNTAFCRIHRNTIVNMDHIRKMSAMSSQRWLITLANNLEFIVSKRQAQSVRQLLSF